INRRRLPDAASVPLAAHPAWARHVPALILLVLWDRVEVPEDLAGFRVDREDVAPGDVALAARAPDVQDAFVELRRRREPVTHADGRLHFAVALVQHVEDDAGLALPAER